MAALFNSPSLPAIPAPPSVPSVGTPSVSTAASDAAAQRATAQGRASTYYTDLQTQRRAQSNAQRTLEMA